MKKRILSLLTALALCLGLTVSAMAAEEQQIVVNGRTYERLLAAILSETEDKPVTLRLESDIQLVSSAIVIGSSDYDGLFGGTVFTVASHDVTIDLNGHTLTGENGYAVFEVQDGYTLTIIDSSEAQTGQVVSQGETVAAVADGAVYNSLPPAAEEPSVPSDDTDDPADVPDNGSGDDDDSAVEAVWFADVKDSDYFAQPVKWAVGKGVTAGTSATTFSPDATCTRGQIITFLWRASGSPEPAGDNPFSDVSSDAYYAKACAWAYEQGIAAGTAFEPEAPCTRAMAVEFMWKQAGSPVIEGSNPFLDVASDASYAQAAVWALENGVTAGTGPDAFSPDVICTRAQIMTFLYHALAD